MKIDTMVIGAGWAGLAAAGALMQAGREVVVLEKARGPGGRSATRRVDGTRFDHGAQYFTARGAAFGRRLQQWRDAGLVEPWRPRLAIIGPQSGHDDPDAVSRFVAVPGMNGVCRRLAEDLDCRFEQRVNGLAFERREWRLEMDSGEILRTGRLVIAAPPAGAAALLVAGDPLHDRLAAVEFEPCIAGMLSFRKPLDPGFDAAFVNRPGALSWAARDSSKPGRKGNNWVLHATGAWSRGHLEMPGDELAVLLAGAFSDLLDQSLPPAAVRIAHRWRHSRAVEPLDEGMLADAERRLVFAGDWLSGNRIEGAWTSGRKAGEWLAGTG